MNTHQVLDTVWEVDNFLPNFQIIKDVYRSGKTPWQSEYSNRLLTPYSSTPDLQTQLQKLLPKIQNIVGQPLTTQVAYVSLDLSGSRIMMHRLHSDIRCFVQVCMSDIECSDLATHFCIDAEFNADHNQDYENIDRFQDKQLLAVSYKPNTAYIFLNQPRIFMGTKHAVPANIVRETFNLHFGSPLKAST